MEATIKLSELKVPHIGKTVKDRRVGTPPENKKRTMPQYMDAMLSKEFLDQYWLKKKIDNYIR